ncbi:TetR/AcrR family transcriptional regulator [Bradyrhizobium sp. Rc3b]|uniref:TetR/AcrR family transcriptional regulator n=1 Tax=Bradyrhizobium sp. Rc3b TaxID=1855322 RepID=UPI001AECE291|nr:TetR/AcrR family transcriptional regulator [Bradyrhizobium sp. Rc3b]
MTTARKGTSISHMRSSGSKKVGTQRLNPRKTPAQTRAALTVDTILEGAADILERYGFDGYTTNEIAARAGVSIGSLYQYFPNKDAVTIALIERETTSMVDAVLAALALTPPRQALREVFKAAVRNQVRRPLLARLLDFEEVRLASLMPASRAGTIIRASLEEFLRKSFGLSMSASEATAMDIVEIAKALNYASGRRGEVDASSLTRSIEAAVWGYLDMKVKLAQQQTGHLRKIDSQASDPGNPRGYKVGVRNAHHRQRLADDEHRHK